MSMLWTRMPGETWLGAAASFVGMWTVMMVAMMLPSLMPTLWRFRESSRLAALIGVGYFFVWTVVGAVAFPIGVALSAVEMRRPLVAGVVVLGAGLVQLTAWKARHLACCREERGQGALRYGMRIGVHCIYSCFGPMAVLFALGLMDFRAMVVVATAVTAERVAPAGDRVARMTGSVAMAAGLLLIARAVGLA
jgi:predicted metal-binding membrane protein